MPTFVPRDDKPRDIPAPDLPYNLASLCYTAPRPSYIAAGPRDRTIPCETGYDWRPSELAKWGNRLALSDGYTGLAQAVEKTFKLREEAWRKLGWTVESFSARLKQPLAIGISTGRIDKWSIALHPLYGLPWIPDASLKGVVRRYVCDYKDVQKSDSDRLFGSPDAIGSVQFFPAIAVSWAGPDGQPKKLLAADHITPHFKSFLDKPDIPVKTYPAEYFDPVPIPLVVVRPGARFLFAMAAESQSDASLGLAWLTECMRVHGFGARARKNMGRFKKIDQEELHHA